MNGIALAALCLLGAAAPRAAVPIGVFRTWGTGPAAPLHLRAGALSIDVAARPCPSPADTEGCRGNGVNNQASITVAAAGVAPITIISDPLASFVRVAAVRLDGRRRRLGVVVDNQWGGSAGITDVTVIEPVAGGFRAVPLRRAGGIELQGRVADHPRDVSGDGIVDIALEDARFAGAFGCNACAPRPPLVLSVANGRAVDRSARRSTRAVFARDEIAVRRWCRSSRRDRNGHGAAYVADAARQGRFATAWRDMLAHYQRDDRWALWQDCTEPLDHGRCPPRSQTRVQRFPESLRAFLVAAGYITPAQAAAAPLA